MISKNRLARADDAVRAQVRAEAEAIVVRLVDWTESLPPDERRAYWRMHAGDFDTLADDDNYVAVCGGSVAPRPGDDVLFAAAEAKMPDDVKAGIARMNELTPAIEALHIWEAG